MKGIVLAGGEGKRLRPLTLKTPKPLILVKGKSLINYNLDLFAKYGVNDVKIIIRSSHQGAYEDWYRTHGSAFAGINIELAMEQEPMGTFGYLFHHLRDWIGAEDFLVTNGDDIKEIDLAAMLAFHRLIASPATLALMNMEQPGEYGAVVVEGNKITAFIEKRAGLPPGLVSAGLYALSPEAFAAADAAFANKKSLMFESDLFPLLAAQRKLHAFVCEGKFYDCGTPERLEKANREV